MPLQLSARALEFDQTNNPRERQYLEIRRQARAMSAFSVSPSTLMSVAARLRHVAAPSGATNVICR
jgi:hypothetical protein